MEAADRLGSGEPENVEVSQEEQDSDVEGDGPFRRKGKG